MPSLKITTPYAFLEHLKEEAPPLPKEKGEEAVRKARKNIDGAREQMMDRHNELVAESQKKMTALLAKKRLEKEIQTAEDTRDLLNEKALAERLKNRQLTDPHKN